VLARKKRTALKFLIKVFLYLLHALWAVPVLLAIRFLTPFILIRVGAFSVWRIGHFVADVGQRKAESQVDRSRRRLDLWYLPSDDHCSNTYWAKITRRWFKVHSLVRYLVFWNRILPVGKAHSMNSSGTHSRDINGLIHDSRDLNGFLENAKLSLPSTLDEESTARRWMAQFGWEDGEPFVCLFVRDSVYLKTVYPDVDWSYHDYRDSDIQTYIQAIEYLTSQGIFVFRMGAKMGSRVEYLHPKFVDYAFCPSRSDLLDVWLFANCSLCITTSSGPDVISDVFRKPILAVNFLPFHSYWSWSNALHYPKILQWKSSGKTLTLSEYLEQTHYETAGYARAGIEITALNSDQIYEAVREGWQRAVGAWPQTERETLLHEKFRNIFKSHTTYKSFHKFFHPDSRLALAFLSTVGRSFLK